MVAQSTIQPAPIVHFDIEVADKHYRVDIPKEAYHVLANVLSLADIEECAAGILDMQKTAMLRAENIHLKAHIDEKEVQRPAEFSDGILKVEEQPLNRHLEKQKQLWGTSLAEQHHNLKSNDGI